MVDLPRISLWADQGTQWTVVGDLPAHTDLDLQVRHNDTGTWQFAVPWDEKAKAVDTDQIVTFDWRGKRIMSGVITKHEKALDDDGQRVLNMSGLDALAYLGYSLAWPRPLQALTNQPLWDENAAAPTVDVAETAVRHIVNTNVVTRRGLALTVPESLGRGTTVRIRPAFDNLLELALRKASRGGIGIKVGIEAVTGTTDITSTVGALTLSFYEPTDRSVRIVFDDADGSVGSWTWSRAAPSATSALVSGVQNKYRVVTRPAAGWTPDREVFVQGPASFDDTELDQAADEALDAGEVAVNVQVTASETQAQQAFTDYNVGDIATARLGAETLVDTITAIGVKVDDGGPTVTPVFGDPDGIDPRDANAKLVRRTRRDVDHQKRRT